jgi:hypothetical protein
MIFASYKFPRLLVPVTLAMFLSAAAWADGVIVDSSVSGSPGAFTYSYEIENQTSLRLLLFSVTFTGDLGAIHSPTGWPTATGIPAPGETIVQWVSAVDPYDVPAFGTLSGFSLTSDSGPGTVTFSTFDVDFNEFAGQTTGPVASTVPEPNSLALLVTGRIGIYAWRLCALRRVRNARIR